MEFVDISMLRYQINRVAGGRVEEDAPPDLDRLEEYMDLIDGLRVRLREKCDQGPFKKGLRYLLAAKNLELAWYCEADHTWFEEDARQLLEFIWRQLYPDEPIPIETPAEVRLVSIGWAPDDWWQARSIRHSTRPGDTICSVAAKHGVSVEHILRRNRAYWSQFGPGDLLPEGRILRLRGTAQCRPEDEYGLSEADLKRLGIEVPG